MRTVMRTREENVMTYESSILVHWRSRLVTKSKYLRAWDTGVMDGLSGIPDVTILNPDIAFLFEFEIMNCRSRPLLNESLRVVDLGCRSAIITSFCLQLSSLKKASPSCMIPHFLAGIMRSRYAKSVARVLVHPHLLVFRGT